MRTGSAPTVHLPAGAMRSPRSCHHGLLLTVFFFFLGYSASSTAVALASGKQEKTTSSSTKATGSKNFLSPRRCRVLALSQVQAADTTGAQQEQHGRQTPPVSEPPRKAAFTPVKSPEEVKHAQQQVLNGGSSAASLATAGPGSFERDCVRKPTISGCDCKEMIAACNTQRDECLHTVDYYINGATGSGSSSSATSPTAVKQALFRAKFDHPLTNTLLLQMFEKRAAKASSKQGRVNYTRRTNSNSSFQTNAQKKSRHFYTGRSTTSTSSATVARIHGTPDNESTPNNFASRVFHEDVDFSKVKTRGKCSEAEMNGLDRCLAMFWQCDRLEGQMSASADAQAENLQFIYDHPGTPAW
ncbi:unnamed protein product [Amoebophrya sp. A120]|nr:unnamed protein product [Amoebophrya sp. A120]|eukprot:GSA120T00011142001.1